jgi:hypothetical protein
MKKLLILIFFSLAICQSLSAQSHLAEFDKAKEIKLLESDWKDVKKTLTGYVLNFSDNQWHFQIFSTNNARVKIDYSSGKCSDKSEDWNVSEWIVTGITIAPNNLLRLKDSPVNYRDFKKEKLYADVSGDIYFKKEEGIALKVNGDEIKYIYLFPSDKNHNSLCDKKDLKEHYSSENWIFGSELKNSEQRGNQPADVFDISFSNDVITKCPSSDSSKKTNCAEFSEQIDVFTNAVDPELEPLTYKYEVSDGKIIGQGAKVIWDLSGVAAGVHTITASVDDGCGFCGKPKTKSITVKN